MEISINAQVLCKDGPCGQSVYVLINPVLDKISHIVVREKSSSIEYIVPASLITGSAPDKIQLDCTTGELAQMTPFIKTEFIEEKIPDRVYDYGGGSYIAGTYFYLPYVAPETVIELPVEQRQVPPEELAVRRGTRVEARDGFVGRVDEFVVEPKECHITHLLMREGHLWGQKDVMIPVSAIREFCEEVVNLNLDKQEVESLPAFPVRRRWA